MGVVAAACQAVAPHGMRAVWRNEALSVPGFESTVVKTTMDEQLYHTSFMTHHRLSADNIAAGAHAGRGRWKIAHANTNMLKTKGYHREHNFGHGQQYLSAFLLSLPLLALLFPTVLAWSDEP
jgi:hypothetical protein